MSDDEGTVISIKAKKPAGKKPAARMVIKVDSDDEMDASIQPVQSAAPALQVKPALSVDPVIKKSEPAHDGFLPDEEDDTVSELIVPLKATTIGKAPAAAAATTASPLLGKKPAVGMLAKRRGKAMGLNFNAGPATPEGDKLVSASGAFELGTFRIYKQGMAAAAKKEVIPEDPNRPINVQLAELRKIGSLGEGAQGSVDKVEHMPSGRILAQKVIRVDMTHSEEADKKRVELFTEVKTYTESLSPYVVQSFGCFYSEGIINIVLEFMDCGSLEHVIKKAGPLPENIICAIAYQCMNGLHYLHEKRRLVHRDLKPANILLNSDGMAKITDFGVSKEVAGTIACKTFVGTFFYMSPERIDTTRWPGGYGFAVDVWALGLILVECALGRYPYPDPTDQMFVYMQLVCEQPPPIDEWLPLGKYSPEFRDFCAQCLATHPGQRPSAAQLIHHKFIAGYDRSADLADMLRDTVIFDASKRTSQISTPPTARA